ncbi:hypothetical protein E2C01_038377 [Portunus trituberculatus]|uniref:Uncharacterized protein n=1 Tax=Portunus trituberculatus TaxID=210409 RepID=A0A5B7FID9_PORTR|nr:hypothetical protein [Portunus trituberculatus]
MPDSLHSSVSGFWRFFFKSLETSGEPGMLLVQSFFMQSPQHPVLVPTFVIHSLPEFGSHLMEVDFEGWEGCGLMERCQAGEVVPPCPEGEPQDAVLHFLQSANSCMGESMQRNRRIGENRNN